MFALLAAFFTASSLLSSVNAHATAWDKSMWGFNFTEGGNRPQDPLMDRTFADWWFHGHLPYPPHPTDFLEFPAGGKTTLEVTCDKGASSSFTSNPGGDIRDGDDVCPGQTTAEYHTTGLSDVKGCAMGIAYIPPSQVNSIKPEDFTIFSVNQTCVWTRFTDFHVPAKMPACPEGGCTCAWFWIHSADSGSEQIYMNGYQCNITGSTSDVPIAQPQVPRRCGSDAELKVTAAPENCTYGAKQPLYWLQQDGNNMFEPSHEPPFYNDLYGFFDGAQDDIFVDSVLKPMNWSGVPTAPLKAVSGKFPSSGSIPAAVAASPSSAVVTQSASATESKAASEAPSATVPSLVSSSPAVQSATLSQAPTEASTTPASEPVATVASSVVASHSDINGTPDLALPASTAPSSSTPTPVSGSSPSAPAVSASIAPPSAAPSGSPAHSSGCKCQACRTSSAVANGYITVTVTDAAPATVTVTMTVTDSQAETESQTTISPQEASSIIASASAANTPVASASSSDSTASAEDSGANPTGVDNSNSNDTAPSAPASASVSAASGNCSVNSKRMTRRRSLPQVPVKREFSTLARHRRHALHLHKHSVH